uniref:tolloid-like protein 2 n=1 Tax=Styela clava TaxID=7725 RepID=UPI00193AC3B4|nr:tolloid-like protein 2 [Styela clava]
MAKETILNLILITLTLFSEVKGNPILIEAEVPQKTVETTHDDSFDAILKINKEQDEEFYQGDIVMPKTKNALQDKTKRWSTTVPYEIHDHFSYDQRMKITTALRELEVRSCLKFIPHSTEPDYVNYEIQNGCYSNVGVVGGKQTISIGSGCDSHRTILHETFHALGFWHEQSRTDRDDNVRIVWEVISPGQEYNFDKYESDQIDDQGVPYDYDSIMHYSDTAFSVNGSRTIIPLKSGAENMGRITNLSKFDIQELNLLYECNPILEESGHTTWTSWSPCDKNCKRERRRFCDGNQCAVWGEEEVETADCDVPCQVGYDIDCGPALITGMSGTVGSPLFPYNYKSNSDCTQTIQVIDEARIHLHFQAMDVEDYAGGCYYDFVHVYDGQDANAPKIGTFCSTRLPPMIISTGNTLTIKFTSDDSVQQRGYLAQYYATTAKEHVCEFENPNDYCGWQDDTSVELIFNSNSGKTVSDGTGPSVDHTFGNDAGRYLFLETSSPAASGQKARIISSMFRATGNNFCFSFWYNMYGINTGTLNVYLVVNDVFTTLVSYSGDKLNDDWYQSSLVIATSSDYQIAIEAVRGNGYRGDIAIDDVILEEGPCK